MVDDLELQEVWVPDVDIDKSTQQLLRESLLITK